MSPSNAPRLTIAVSTLGARLARLCLPPPDPAITYVVLVQGSEQGSEQGVGQNPDLAARPDVTLHSLASLGVAASRNAALALAKTDYLLFGDDDIALDLTGVLALLAVLETENHLAIVTGQRSGPVPARYASAPRRLRLWNCAKTATPEMLLRLAPVRAAGLSFDTQFGLGARFPLGEEFVFLADALRAGLRGRFLPIVIGHHPRPSTGADWADPVLLRARMAVLARVFGRAAPLWRLALGLKHRKRLCHDRGQFWGFVTGRL